MFSLSEGQRQQPPKLTISTAEGSQQSGPTAVALVAAAPANAAVTGTRVFPAVSSKGVAEAPASSAGTASAAVPAAAPATSGTVLSAASIRGAVGARESSAGAVSSDAAAEAQRGPAVLLLLLRRRRGRLERSRQQLGPLVTAEHGRSAGGVCGFIREGEYRCGDNLFGRAPFRQP